MRKALRCGRERRKRLPGKTQPNYAAHVYSTSPNPRPAPHAIKNGTYDFPLGGPLLTRIYGVTTRQRALLPVRAHSQSTCSLGLYKLLHIDFFRNHKHKTTALVSPAVLITPQI